MQAIYSRRKTGVDKALLQYNKLNYRDHFC